MTTSGTEPATFRFVTQHLNHCATAVPNKSEYQGYILWGKGSGFVGQMTFPPSCPDCLDIAGASTSWSPKGLSRPVCGLPSPCYIFLRARILNKLLS